MSCSVKPEVIEWLLESDEPWTRFRTRLDLLGQPVGDAHVQRERAAMFAHPQIQALVNEVAVCHLPGKMTAFRICWRDSPSSFGPSPMRPRSLVAITSRWRSIFERLIHLPMIVSDTPPGLPCAQVE